ncbi:MAG: hypothetical protein ACLP1Y_11795 [Candidatus Acidiferrales bacterium]
MPISTNPSNSLAPGMRTVSERRSLSARPILITLALVLSISIPFSAQDRPIMRVQEDCSSFAYAYDGRIAYSVRQIFHVKKLTFERDDIWILSANGGKRRLIEGEKFTRGDSPISYKVVAFRWSPDSKQLAVELFTGKMTNAHGDTTQGTQTLLLNDSGSEIKIPGGDSLIAGASDAQWLSDNDTLVYLGANASGAGPSTVNELHAASGRTTQLFADHWFAAVAWYPQQQGGVAVETNTSRSGAIKLVWLDLEHQTIRDLANLDAYVTGLSISPSGRRVAYYIDPEVLEVRDLGAPQRVARGRIAVGTYFWAADDSRILLKRGPAQEMRDIVWIQLPPLAIPRPGAPIPISEPIPQPIFHDLEYPAFAISPDGRQLAIVDPGHDNINIYPLP